MDVDSGVDRDEGFGQENGEAGGAATANGGARRDDDGMLAGAEEIAEGDVAVLSNHRSEVSRCVMMR